MSRAKLIVIEGVDGAGKSVLAHAVADELSRRRREVALFAFPSKDGAAGRLIRRVFSGEEQISARSMLHLFVADGLDHETAIRGMLDEGMIVVCDRHTVSSALAYQLDEHSIEYVRAVQEPLFRPADLLCVVDVPYEVARFRIDQRGVRNPLYEKDEREHHDRLRERYRRAAEILAVPTLFVDGTDHLPDVVGRIVGEVLG